MASGLRWTTADYEKAQARAKFPQTPAILPDAFRNNPVGGLSAGALPIVQRNSVTITLPFPPTLNHMHVNVSKGRIRSKEYVAFCGMVAHIVDREKAPKFGTQRLAVAITLHWPNKRKGDLDNRAKSVLDSLQRAGVYLDDEQVDSLTITRGAIIKGGLAVVLIEAM
jgi:crossover junction endodeoxyribonuclease RusA